MNILDNMTIKNRMILSFTLMVVIFTVLGMVSMNRMRVLGQLTSTLYNHPLQVSNAALNAKAGVISMHRSMKDVSTSQSHPGITMAIQRVQSEEKRVYQELDTIKTLILGREGKQLIQETVELFAGWKPIRIEVEELVLKGDISAANKITREKGADYVHRLERKMLELTSYALHKADGFIKDARKVESTILKQAVVFIVALAAIALTIGFLISSSILSSLSSLKETMTKIIESGDLTKVDLKGNNEITEMGELFNGLIERLKQQFWLGKGQNMLNLELSGELTYDDILKRAIDYTSRYVDACVGALYHFNAQEGLCELKSSYAFVERNHLANKFKLGEGIVGQVAIEKKSILLKNITRQDAVGQSGTLSEPPVCIYAIPLFYEENLYGVLEVASFEDISGIKREFLESAGDVISVFLHTAFQGEQIKKLFNRSRQANEKLQAQTEELQAQTEELQAQAEELQALNQEFQQQSDELKVQNRELEAQRRQVEEANRLKSEFLSNMSHELRTPLNSVNALSRVLILQAREKLSLEEVSYLEIIERNGKHLLSLINDILDLSKIEAGRMDISLGLFSVKTLIENITESIEPLAREKNIKLEQNFSKDFPQIESDESRVFQILQNIIANGVKFTNQGAVTISGHRQGQDVCIKVKDTGIGISDADVVKIFKEFRQVDGASTRKFEGTGLGLAIAYKAAKMLGGDITVESAKGLGSTFTIILPIKYMGSEKMPESLDTVVATTLVEELDAEKAETILIVDDDPGALEMIAGAFSCEGYQTLTTTSGKEAIKLAERYQPVVITLDVIMPEMDGWEVLSLLKKNPLTSTIPVVIVSVADDRDTGFALGAVGYVTKPVDQRTLIGEISKIYGYLPSTVMVVDDSEMDRKQTAQIITAEGMNVVVAHGGKSCLKMLETSLPDVIVLDLVMPGMDGFEVLEHIRKTPTISDLPVIIVTAKDLSFQERQTLQNNASSILLKSESTSAELVGSIKSILNRIGKKGIVFKGEPDCEKNKILLVEDNDAAVIQVKKALETMGLSVDVAHDGRQALEYIRHTIPKGIIMDLMMPNIDGFQVLESIRGTRRTENIPVLILTAKDLTEDDLKKIGSNNVRHLIQKGDVDKDELMHRVKLMLGDVSRSLPEKADHSPYRSGPSGIHEGGRPLILVVEDNPDNMATFKAVLGREYTIKEAVDGEQGLKKAFEWTPDLILLDISLPKMDGLSVVRELKNSEKTKRIPVIALTAQAMKGDREKILHAGCDDYVAKPVDPEKMTEQVKQWLSTSL